MGVTTRHTLPDFIIIGAQKAGTTTIYQWLLERPDVIAHEKEIGYFSHHYHRGADWYRRHFPTEWRCERFMAEHGRPLFTGEATPEYLLDPHTPPRMVLLIPDVNLIVSLRNPVDRAYSQFQMNRRRGIEPIESFTDALSLEDPRFGGPRARRRANCQRPLMARWTHYLRRGHYAESLSQWFAVFPREQFCIVTVDDMATNPTGTLAAVESFLCLPPHPREVLKPHNEALYPPPQAATRAALVEYFRPHNERLYELLGRDLGWEA